MSGISPGQSYSPAVTTAGRRDAFHAACILCSKAESSKYHIDPGDRVKIVGDSEARWWDEDDGDDWDGVADPFVEKIPRGSLFWVFLRPSRYTNLTHQFQLNIPDDREPTDEPVVTDDWSAGCRKCDS